jgi:DEAD/DEAH box helicase domain-containing protein
MRKIVFDIESRNVFGDVGTGDPSALDLSLVGIYDSETDSYTSYLQDELGKLWPILERSDMLIGFNSNHFDLPLLNKYYPGDLTKLKSFDLLEEIRKSCGRRLKLDKLAEGTFGKKKLGNGFDAIRWWKTGEIGKIRDYCLEDVKLTKELYDYALANGKLLFKEGRDVKEVKLDPSEWEAPSENKLTFSLPF